MGRVKKWFKKRFCFHQWEGGHGAMGDGYDCLKCGHATYASPRFIYYLFNRVDKGKPRDYHAAVESFFIDFVITAVSVVFILIVTFVLMTA